MSEFSESYHIRASDLAQIARKLEEAGLPGLAFPPAKGWISYVPFAEGDAYKRLAGEGDGAFAASLSQIVATDVVQYVYAEDHLWAFALCRSGTILGRYMCAWDPEFAITNDIDVVFLQPYRAGVTSLEDWRPLLQPASYEAVVDEGIPQRFAAELGLGRVDWLSPHYAQADPTSFIGDGAIVIGTRPVSPAEKIEKPQLRRLTLPSPRPTARETFAALSSALKHWDPYCAPYALRGGRSKNSPFLPLPIGEDGRARPHGAWSISFASRERGAHVHINVAASGDVDEIKVGPLLRARRLDGTVIESPLFPANWLDSPEVLAIAAQHPLVASRDRYPPLFAVSAQLMAWGGEKLIWLVEYYFYAPEDRTKSEVRVELHFDPETGALCAQRRSRVSQGRVEDWPAS